MVSTATPPPANFRPQIDNIVYISAPGSCGMYVSSKPGNEISIRDYSIITNLEKDFIDLSYKAYLKNFEFISTNLKTPLSDIKIFCEAKGIKLENLFPLKTGGFAATFSINNIKYMLEVFNDNEDVFSIQEANQPIKAWDINHKQILSTLNSKIKYDL